MKRYFIIKDGTIQASTVSKEEAEHLIKTYRDMDRRMAGNPLLYSEYWLIHGEEIFKK